MSIQYVVSQYECVLEICSVYYRVNSVCYKRTNCITRFIECIAHAYFDLQKKKRCCALQLHPRFSTSGLYPISLRACNVRLQELLHVLAVVRGHNVVGVLAWARLNCFATNKSVEGAQIASCAVRGSARQAARQCRAIWNPPSDTRARRAMRF